MKRFSQQYYINMQRHIDTMPPHIRKVFDELVQQFPPLTGIDVMGLYGLIAPENNDEYDDTVVKGAPRQLVRLAAIVAEIVKTHQASVN